MQSSLSIQWRRLDDPGDETATFTFSDDQWLINGRVDLRQGGITYALNYKIICDKNGVTESVVVSGTKNNEAIHLTIENKNGDWFLNDVEIPGCKGCVDIDLSFSPSTNTLPIRRLNLTVGQKINLRMAWLRLPDLTLEALEQSYERVSERSYRYSSTSFTADLEVDAHGIIANYPGAWEKVVNELPDVFIDGDACPVKEDTFRVAKRYQLKVYVVSNRPIFLPKADWIIPVVAENRFDAVDDYIDETIRPNDIAVTNDLLLVARLLKREARVLDPRGKVFTDDNIGEALATRELLSELRQYGDNHFGPKKKAKRDHSSFLSSLDQLIHQAIRAKKSR